MAPKKDQASGKSGKKAKAGEGMDGGQHAKMLGLLKYQAQHGKVQVNKNSYLSSTYYYYVLSTICLLPRSSCFLLSLLFHVYLLLTMIYYARRLCTYYVVATWICVVLGE